ncbi:hypothetical protein CKY51_13165 [Xanthomonas maliensis]|nr:hypothetical protein CKY51_13165 [Xanthomonas maliensis]
MARARERTSLQCRITVDDKMNAVDTVNRLAGVSPIAMRDRIHRGVGDQRLIPTSTRLKGIATIRARYHRVALQVLPSHL